jgi:hypothetical protein
VAIEHTPSGAFLHFDGAPKGWRCAAGTAIAHYDRWNHDTIAKLIGGSGTLDASAPTPGAASGGTPSYRPGWAPPQDRNDTGFYIARVAHATGFAPDTVLDFHRYDHLKPVLLAMAAVEQGASPYTWWTDAQIDWGLAQYGVLPPAKPIAKAPIVGGAVAAATAAAQTVGTIATTNAPPPVTPPPGVTPPIVAPDMPAPDIGSTVQQAQGVLQSLAPYFKWAGVALLLLMAGAAAWWWWREHHKRTQGIA